MEITFLTEEQSYGKEALNVLKNYGTKAALTDLALILGGCQGGRFFGRYAYTVENERSGYIWTSTIDESVRTIADRGSTMWYKAISRRPAGRPALPTSETRRISRREMKTLNLPDGKTVQTIEYGMYPQMAAHPEIADALEKDFKWHRLKKNGQSFTFDGRQFTQYEEEFKPRSYPVYEKDGKSYIRIKSRLATGEAVLSDGSEMKKGKIYWIEVQPIEWLMDHTGIWVSKKGLFAGIQMNGYTKNEDNFNRTAMKAFLQIHFAEEIMLCPQRTTTHAQSQEKTQKNKIARQKKALELITIGRKYDHATRRAAAAAMRQKERE